MNSVKLLTGFQAYVAIYNRKMMNRYLRQASYLLENRCWRAEVFDVLDSVKLTIELPNKVTKALLRKGEL